MPPTTTTSPASSPSKPATAPVAPTPAPATNQKVPAVPTPPAAKSSKEPDDLVSMLESVFDKKAESTPPLPKDNGAPPEPEDGVVTDQKKPELPGAKPKPTQENNLAALRQRMEAAERERDELKAKVEKPQPVEEHPQFKSVSQRLVEIEKENKELAETLKHANYEKSPEFRDKYKKPLEKAWADAYQEVESLTYTDAEGNVRQATRDQMNKLIQLPKREAAELAEEWFGRHMGSEIMQHRRNIETLHRQSVEAVANFEKEAETIERNMAEQRTKETELFQKVWNTANEVIVEKFPDLFKVSDEDKPELEKAYKNVDLILGALVRGDPNIRTEKGAMSLAIIRQAAAHLHRLSKQTQAMKAKLEKAESDLAEFRKNDAGTGLAGGRQDDNGHDENTDSILESAFGGRK